MNRYAKNMLKSTLLGQVLIQLKLNSFKRKWIRQNQHNQTVPMNIFSNEVTVGKNTYGQLNIVSFGKKTKLIIGNFVSIAENVHFLLDVEHHVECISTYPFIVKLLGVRESESFSKGDIIVEDDVWIGFGATILSGVKIGKGAVIAAGSVVTKDIPPYTIVGGVPARLIRQRFNDEIIEKVSEIDLESLDKSEVANLVEYLYTPVTEESLKGIMNAIDKCERGECSVT